MCNMDNILRPYEFREPDKKTRSHLDSDLSFCQRQTLHWTNRSSTSTYGRLLQTSYLKGREDTGYIDTGRHAGWLRASFAACPYFLQLATKYIVTLMCVNEHNTSISYLLHCTARNVPLQFGLFDSP